MVQRTIEIFGDDKIHRLANALRATVHFVNVKIKLSC